MTELYVLLFRLAFRLSVYSEVHLKEIIRCTCKNERYVSFHPKLDATLSKDGTWNVRLETIGSPALGQGSNCKLFSKVSKPFPQRFSRGLTRYI